jgi:3D-(3,5/4)-trihydroxycyclohexane-1,2-dione acylhydrolase (decyclizing)
VTLIALNVAPFDAAKHGALPLVADAKRGMEELSAALGGWQVPAPWSAKAATLMAEWNSATDRVTAPTNAPLPSDAQVLGAVNRQAGHDGVVVCAAGGLPGELHKLWRAANHRGYHVEYGYSCMGYEIAGGLGVKLALPEREVFVLVGDGSYLMMNSEIATAVAMDKKLILVVLDNHGFGCIDRLQQACGGESFNNLWGNSFPRPPVVDFVAHARSLGATAEKAAGIADLEAALKRARQSRQTYVVVIETDPAISTLEGGAWWDVPVPETSDRPAVKKARAGYVAASAKRRVGG